MVILSKIVKFNARSKKVCFYFPFKCIFKIKFYIAIPFFWMTALARYYGFFKAILNKSFKYK